MFFYTVYNKQYLYIIQDPITLIYCTVNPTVFTNIAPLLPVMTVQSDILDIMVMLC